MRIGHAKTPILGGKAAENHHWAPILAHLWTIKYSKDADAATPAAQRAHDTHVSAVLSSLADMIFIFDAKNVPGHTLQFLTDAASREVRDLINRLLVHCDYLETISGAADFCLWEASSKFHSLWHCGFESQFGYPAAARVYLNEDYMGHIKAVAMAERYNVSATNRSRAIAERVSMGMSLSLWVEARDTQ